MSAVGLLTGRVVGAASVVAAMVIASGLPAQAADFTTGHYDVLDVDYAAGALTLNIRQHVPLQDNVSPATNRFMVGSAYFKAAAPGGACTPKNGSGAYVMSQTAVTGQLWPGWDTAGIPAGALVGDTVNVSVAKVSGPTGGNFAIFTTNSFGAPTFRLNTNPATGCTLANWPGGIVRNTHGHGNWVFSHPGAYVLRFTTTATKVSGGTVTAQANYTFVVG